MTTINPATESPRAAEQQLAQRIAAFQTQFATQAPPEALAAIQQDIAAMVQAKLAAHALTPGASAPEFTLPDALGEPVALSTLLAQGPIALVFYRGEWCPYCNLALHAYQQILPQISALGATLVAVSPQTPDHSLALTEKHALAFPVLSDAGNHVARQYGLVFSVAPSLRPVLQSLGIDLPTYNSDDSWELPVPAVFIITQDGVIQYTSVDADFTHRLEPNDLLAALAGARR